MSETYGRYLLNTALPEKYKITGKATKSSLKSTMLEYAKTDPAGYAQSITKIKQIGDSVATQEGLSIGLDDLTPDYAKREEILKPIRRKFFNTRSDDTKRELAIVAQGRMEELSAKHPGMLTLQVESGGRGNAMNRALLVGGMGYVRDYHGSVLPWIVEKTYSEGLKPADYWAATGQAMMDQLKTRTSISEPGELAKKLVVNMQDQVVSESDCGTENGLWMDTLSPEAVDRFVARDQGSIKRNTLITPINQAQLSKDVPRILVRSPMTCEAADGVCQRCQGLDERGHIHSRGINVGTRAAQAMAEPLTQMSLNARHGARNLKTDKQQLDGVKGLRQLIETPEQFAYKSVLAEKDGVVESVTEAPQGGYDVIINKTKHYVEPGLDILVKKGQTVEKGQALSTGIERPADVVRLRGLAAGREYLVGSLNRLYKNQGMDVDNRHFELLAKSTLNHARILNDPSNRFIKGDVVGYNALKGVMRADTKQMETRSALGETLGIAYPGYAAGTRVTQTVIRDLLDQRITSVIISPRAPTVEFVMKSATSAPKENPDWIARMSHQGLKRSIMQAAAFGEKSNIHGYHPVPAYTYGIEFGEGEDGKY